MTTIANEPSAAVAYQTLADSLAKAEQPQAVFDALSGLYQNLVGFRMITIICYDRPRGMGRRVYSSSPDTHPIGGDKAIPQTEWVDQVLSRHEVFVANHPDDFKDHYSDWKLLEEMGLRAGVNYPVVVNGVTIGSVNLTADEGYFTPARVEAGLPLAGPAALALLVLDHLKAPSEAK
jgi:hypothetical protein